MLEYRVVKHEYQRVLRAMRNLKNKNKQANKDKASIDESYVENGALNSSSENVKWYNVYKTNMKRPQELEAPGMVAHTCNPSNQSEHREIIMSLRSA